MQPTMITLLYSLIFILSIYTPSIRISGIPILLSDLILLITFTISLWKVACGETIDRRFFLLLVPVFLGLMLVLARSIYGLFEFKDIAIPTIHLKMFMAFVSFTVLWRHINKKILLYIVLLGIFGQLIIAILQKSGVPGFASGIFYDLAVRNAMANVYYGDDVSHTLATHLNVTFRPIGFIGSPTILSTYLVVFLKLNDSLKPSIKIRSMLYGSLLLCFSKITIIGYVIYNYFLLPIQSLNQKKIIMSSISFIIATLAFMVFLNMNERMYDYFLIFIKGEDYGVTHRVSVIEFMSDLSLREIIFGVGGNTSFIFDSGFLITIFRFGIIYLVLVYAIYYRILKIFHFENLHVFVFVMLIVTDLTIGTFHNQMFFYLISFSAIQLKHLQEKNGIQYA
ncbi:hypothetical protein [Pantoea agglomerans]|uniref:hypothetical protein n=1 Tax=Enterobacter agglomerans TaxID=549 RepID=UPI00104B25C3|nr:hypothetical protein [Pantoea agglomerans]TCZ24272.1 hypothetical protein EYB39_18005 [Pantoea agglomerans]